MAVRIASKQATLGFICASAWPVDMLAVVTHPRISTPLSISMRAITRLFSPSSPEKIGFGVISIRSCWSLLDRDMTDVIESREARRRKTGRSPTR